MEIMFKKVYYEVSLVSKIKVKLVYNVFVYDNGNWNPKNDKAVDHNNNNYS